VAWREALALVGVLVASVLPSLAGLAVAAGTFAVLLALGVLGLWRAPRPPLAGALPLVAVPPVSPAPQAAVAAPTPGALSKPWQVADFRRLLVVFLVNGIATAVPATLVLFFIRDRLQAQAWEPLFLASYFAAGALSMPLWVRLVGRWGLARAWRAGMVLAIEPMVNAGRAEVRIKEDGWTAVTEDGTRSAHFEHSVAVTESGPEILSLA
jgi:Na+/melibiose symporter-like transporter